MNRLNFIKKQNDIKSQKLIIMFKLIRSVWTVFVFLKKYFKHIKAVHQKRRAALKEEEEIMGNRISLGKLLSLNVRDIENLFGKEKLPGILKMLRTHKKIIEKNIIEKRLKEADERKKELAENLALVKTELKNIEIAY